VRGLAGIHLMWFDLLERANPSNKLDTIASNVIFQQNASMALAKGISYINNCQFALHSFSGMAWDVDVNITISHFPEVDRTVAKLEEVPTSGPSIK
jgi:hypothetical protein